MILFTLAKPVFTIVRGARRDAALLADFPAPWWLWGMLILGTLLAVGFFTIHFGMFHYIHSQLLLSFFPVETSGGASTYAEILRLYWPFLPAAFLAERAAFMRQPLSIGRDSSSLVGVVSSVAGNRETVGDWIAAPYKNVLRLHLLIFFFFFTHFVKLDNFAVYAVVYAVYFFPWRLVRRAPAAAAPA